MLTRVLKKATDCRMQQAAKKQCNFRFTVIFIMPRRGVKNHLSFTSKNCKVKIHDLLSWAMILHAFCKRTKAMEAQKKFLAYIRVPIRVSCNLLFSFKENAMQLLLEKFGEILVIRKRLMRKGRKRLKT